MANTSLNVRRSRAGQLKGLRTGLLKQLFAKARLVDPNPQTQVLNDIASSFSRFAAYQQTAFDSGASRSSSSNDASSMERQVQRVFNQVLGGATGRGPNSFMNALNNAFPTTGTSEGQQTCVKSIGRRSRGPTSRFNSCTEHGFAFPFRWFYEWSLCGRWLCQWSLSNERLQHWNHFGGRLCRDNFSQAG